ncbi:hypothetical protein AMTR_s00074p00029810 [Amborella trichopoda]|uniref:Uncharacterized protein n=1 Tax=Amborella trichopoda TaxID=13333 RepID=W1NPI7_AMBTC|nr:hypothetical protein AMTR_s00074p00029810 [Amborella trichopoda]
MNITPIREVASELILMVLELAPIPSFALSPVLTSGPTEGGLPQAVEASHGAVNKGSSAFQGEGFVVNEVSGHTEVAPLLGTDVTEAPVLTSSGLEKSMIFMVTSPEPITTMVIVPS